MEDREHIESDLGTAAYLLSRNFKLLGLQTSDGRRYFFRFSDPSGKAEGEVVGYLTGTTVVAREIVDAQKTLKTILYNKKRRDGVMRDERNGNQGR